MKSNTGIMLKSNQMDQPQSDKPKPQPRPLPEPNPVTRQKYKQQVFKQITLPLIIGIVLVVLLMLLAVQATNYGASKAADVATIWLVGPMILMGLISLALFVLSIYGMVKFLKVLPSYFRIAQDTVQNLKFQVFAVDDKLTDPIIQFQTFTAKIKGFFSSVRRN